MQPKWLLRKRTSIATIVIHGRGQVAALTFADERSPTHEFSDNNVSSCFCGPRFSPLSLHAARFRRTATILSPCGPLVASSHAEDNHGDRTKWPGLLVRRTRIQFEPQHWRVAICPFYCGDRAVSDLVAKADSGSRWRSLRRDFLAMLVSCPHAREFNRYRTHGSGLGSVARRRLRSRKDASRPRSIGRLR